VKTLLLKLSLATAASLGAVGALAVQRLLRAGQA
jgi:hypothetical protein